MKQSGRNIVIKINVQKSAKTFFALLVGVLIIRLFLLVSVVEATGVPNPGHPWTDIGDGNVYFTGATGLHTYTLPDATSTILTTAAAVTVSQGGTGAISFPSGGFLFGNGNSSLSASSSPTIGWINATSTTATSTFGDGINLANGCYAVNGTCLSSGSGSGTVNSGTAGQFGYYASNGTAISGSSILTQAGSNIGIGTTSPFTTLSVNGTGYFGGNLTATNLTATGTASIGTLNGIVQGINGLLSASSTVSVAYGGTGLSSAPSYGQVLVGNALSGYSLTATSSLGITSSQWTTNGSNIYYNTGNVGIGTTSPSSALSIVGGFFTTATSTGMNGINLTAGCFSVSGTCVGSGGGSGTVNSGLTGQFAYYAANGTALTATSSIFLTSNGNVGIGTTSPFAQLSVNAVAGTPEFAIGSSTKTNFIVDQNGNVGIGTTSPFAPLSVVGNVYIGGTITSTSTIDAAQGFYNNGNFFGMASGTRNYLIGSNTRGTTTPNTGTDNFFVGNNAGQSNTTGTYNNFLGNSAGYLNTIGTDNNFLGYQAGASSTSATSNNFLGHQAGYNNTTGNYNNFLGYLAGLSNISGTDNNFLGYQAGYYNNGGGYNNFLGNSAGYNNTNGLDNNFLGFQAGYYNTNGNYNNFIGIHTGINNITGSSNNFIGRDSGYNNTSGIDNNFFGLATGNDNTTGSENIAIGKNALYYSQSGGANIALGYQALYGSLNNSMGSSTAIGYQAGLSNTTGGYNTFLGYGADASTGALTNATAIGKNAKVGASNSLVLGGTGVDSVNVGIGTSSPSSALSIVGGFFTTATSTGMNGINLTAGCFSVSGTCVGSGGGSGTVNSGLLGQFAYYAANGTTLTATSSLFIDTSGDIGIGTTSPKLYNGLSNHLLDVESNLNPGIALTNSSNNYEYFMYNDGNLNFFNATKGIDQMLITSAGYVGIGTSSPSSTLSVTGNEYFNSNSITYASTSASSFVTTYLSSVNNQIVPTGYDNVWSISTSTAAIPVISISTRANSTNGVVGIGTTTPWAKLAVEMGMDNPAFVVSDQGSTSPAFIVTGAVTNGRVGIGTSTPMRQLDVNGNWGGNSVVDNKVVTSTTSFTESTPALVYHLTQNSGTTNTSITVTFNITGLPNVDGTFAFIETQAIKGITSSTRATIVTVQINGTQVSTITTPTQTAASTIIKNYVLVRSNATWHLVGAAGSSDTSDLAEWIPFSGTMPQAGQIVSIANATNSPAIALSQNAYDQNVAGVISTLPNTIMGQEGPDKVLLALAGRVPVQVSNENGPINIGDYITSSSVPGIGMKALKAGPVIGKAMEAYSSNGVGTITVLVGTTYFNGTPITRMLAGIDLTNPDAVGKAAVQALVNQTASSTASTTVQSEILTDRLSAGLEIISPRLFAQGLNVDSISALDKELTFKDDVIFFGRPYFTTDTAGFALVNKGDRQVTITFDRPYIEQPIVNASMSFDMGSSTPMDTSLTDVVFNNNIQYVITQKSVNGFSILLNKPAPEALQFNWTAFAVKGAKTFTSQTIGINNNVSQPSPIIINPVIVPTQGGTSTSNTVSSTTPSVSQSTTTVLVISIISTSSSVTVPSSKDISSSTVSQVITPIEVISTPVINNSSSTSIVSIPQRSVLPSVIASSTP